MADIFADDFTGVWTSEPDERKPGTTVKVLGDDGHVMAVPDRRTPPHARRGNELLRWTTLAGSDIRFVIESKAGRRVFESDLEAASRYLARSAEAIQQSRQALVTVVIGAGGIGQVFGGVPYGLGPIDLTPTVGEDDSIYVGARGQVLRTLEDSRWTFRTVDGIARELGMTQDAVFDAIHDLGERVRRPLVPDPAGRTLYTAAARRPSWRERYLSIRSRLATW